MNPAVHLAVIRELEVRLKEAKHRLNEQLLSELEEGDTKAANLGDVRLGKASKTRGRTTPTVVDGPALLRWVKAHHPTEVHTVETVRPAYLEKLRASAKTHGEAVDESTGEIIPGIELREGNPYISFRMGEGAGEVIAQRWQELLRPVLLLGDS